MSGKPVKFGLLLFCFLKTLQPTWGQPIRAVTIDAESQKPLADVFVFYNNSSIGTVTDSNGCFLLPSRESSLDEVVFSHLNYEDKNIPFDQIQYGDTIFLTQKQFILTPAVITSKARPQLRARRLRQFKQEFLGDVPDRLVWIENPEVLLFEDADMQIRARAQSPLVLMNTFLGYKVYFYLKDFAIHQDEGIDYAGTVFFESLKGNRKEVAKWKRNRKKIYKRSSRKFFTELITNDFKELNYVLGYSSVDPVSDQFVDLIELPDLPFTQTEDDHYELSTSGYLTIIDLNTISKHQVTTKKSGKLGMKMFEKATTENAVSYLFARRGKIIFNEFGHILNAEEIEEYGYWASLRVGSLLPLNYRPY